MINYIYVPYGVLCAINNIKLGIAKSYYMDWAQAYGLAKSTANNYWHKAHKYVEKQRKNPDIYYK